MAELRQEHGSYNHSIQDSIYYNAGTRTAHRLLGHSTPLSLKHHLPRIDNKIQYIG